MNLKEQLKAGFRTRLLAVVFKRIGRALRRAINLHITWYKMKYTLSRIALAKQHNT